MAEGESDIDVSAVARELVTESLAEEGIDQWGYPIKEPPAVVSDDPGGVPPNPAQGSA